MEWENLKGFGLEEALQNERGEGTKSNGSPGVEVREEGEGSAQLRYRGTVMTGTMKPE